MGLWIVCGILAALLLLLMIPLRLEAAYDGDVRVRLGYLFFRWGLVGFAEKKKAGDQKKEKKAEPSGEKKKKKFDLGAFFDLLEMILTLVKAAIPPLGYLFRHTKLSPIRVWITVGGEDAAEVAIRVGQVQAVLHGVLATLRNVFLVGEVDVAVGANYHADESEGEGSLVLRVRPMVLLIAGIWAGVRMLLALLQRNRQKEPHEALRKTKGFPHARRVS